MLNISRVTVHLVVADCGGLAERRVAGLGRIVGHQAIASSDLGCHGSREGCGGYDENESAGLAVVDKVDGPAELS